MTPACSSVLSTGRDYSWHCCSDHGPGRHGEPSFLRVSRNLPLVLRHPSHARITDRKRRLDLPVPRRRHPSLRIQQPLWVHVQQRLLRLHTDESVCLRVAECCVQRPVRVLLPQRCSHRPRTPRGIRVRQGREPAADVPPRVHSLWDLRAEGSGERTMGLRRHQARAGEL